MIDDIANLYKQILEKENSKEKEVPVQKEEDITLNESVEEPFDSFLAKLGEKISEELIDKNPQDERVADIVSATLPENSHKYIQELQKVDKPNHLNILSEEEKKINNIISEQIQEEIGKVKTQISRMAIEGGGGSVAVQYANGGTMNGDLNVMGRYLSAGVDLATLIGTGGGGGLSGTTDRLISGSQMLKLNSDGTINFPSNTISPQDNTILNLESKTTGSTDFNKIALSPYGFFAYDANSNSITIDSNDNDVTISSQGLYDWKFNNKGQIEGPSGTLSVLGNLSASGRVYQNGNDLQSEIESISSFALSTKTTVQSNSASWNYQGTDIKALTAGWVGGNSAYTTVQAYSASWAIDSTTDTGVRALTSNWQSTYTTVLNNSASWDYQGTDIKNLTAGWVGGNDAYTNLVANSAAYLSAVDLSFLSVSGNWNSTYSTVQTYSASWGAGGSDVSGLSANWQSTYTTVSSNSAHWESAYTTLQTNSATWNTIIGGTSQVLIAEVKNAEGITLNRGDVVYTFGATGGTMSVKLASDANDGTSSKTIGLVNGTIAAGGTGYITTVGRMDQLNLGSFLEGQALWVGSTAGTFTNVRPTAPNHAVYLGVVERANNGNGIAYIKIQNGYELGELHDVLTNGSVQAGDYLQRNSTNTLWVPSTLSADKWNSSYTTVQSNSATTWNYQGTDLKSLSSNWQNTYTNYSSNSASYVKTNVADTTPVYFIRAITQTEYDAIAIKDPNTLYFITT